MKNDELAIKEKVTPFPLEKIDIKTIKKRDDFDLLTQIYYIQSPSKHEEDMRTFLHKFLNTIEGVTVTVDNYNNIYATKGVPEKSKYYPGIACHIDTVHKKESNRNIYYYQDDKENIIIWAGIADDKDPKNITQTGGCGDDGAGIFVALQLLQSEPCLKAAFFVEEEIGRLGAKNSNIEFFSDCGFILEGDRQNKGDLITKYFTSYMGSGDFLTLIKSVGEKYGFEETLGSFTDVSELVSRDVGISAINFSVGYYHPHTATEHTVFNELLNSVAFAKAFIKAAKYKRFSHKYERYSYTPNKSYPYYDDHYGTRYPGSNYHHWKSNRYDTNNYNSDDYWKKKSRENVKNNEVKDSCICTEPNLINPKCPLCNPIIDDFSIKKCPDCNSALVERKLSFECPVCYSNIFLKFNTL